ncbi:MAG: hypothetical protein IJH75_01525 [Mogibacterium sp.]|nr:hypothetical protein [Mogibacterium sp.]
MKSRASALLSLVLSLMMVIQFTAVIHADTSSVAKIGDTEYETLQAAIDAAQAGETVTILRDVTDADGAVVESGKSVVIDLNGCTYNISGELVGEADDESSRTCGFYLQPSSTLTIMNGTVSSSSAAMLVQNFGNLTLQDVTLDGSSSGVVQYVLSNNSGVVEMIGGTNIYAASGCVAFDVCWAPAYPGGTQVTVNTYGTISGIVQLDGWDENTAPPSASTLTINSGTFNGSLAVDESVFPNGEDGKNPCLTIAAGTFSYEIPEAYLAENSAVTASGGSYVVAEAAPEEPEDPEPGDDGSGGTQEPGNTGETGSTGETGDTGNTGETGTTGETGSTGDTGNTGETGTAGDTGSTDQPTITVETETTGDSGQTGNTGSSTNEQPSTGNDTANNSSSTGTDPADTTQASSQVTEQTNASNSTSSTESVQTTVEDAASLFKTYSIIKDDDNPYHVWVKGSDENLVMRSDAPYEKFEDLYIDGDLVDSSKYKVEKGSTIITLKPEYLETLSVADHEFYIKSTDGETVDTIIITAVEDKKEKKDPNIPETGDTEDFLLWSSILMASLIAMFILSSIHENRKVEYEDEPKHMRK